MRVQPAAAAPPDHSSCLPVDIRRLPWIRRLAADYVYNFEGLAPFVAGSPADPAAWAAAEARAAGHGRNRAAIAAVLAAQQEARGAPQAARDAAGRLADPSSVAVLTGQQAGLFGGPLFTLLKALTALGIAETLAREDGVPAVAVFWIDAEDHDWDEVRSCAFLDANLDTATAGLPPRSGPESAVGSTRLDPGITAAIDALAAGLPPTEFTAPLLERLRAVYAPGATMAQAFGRWLESLLGHRGLVVFDAADPAAKPLVADLFAREIRGARGDRASRRGGRRRARRARLPRPGRARGGLGGALPLRRRPRAPRPPRPGRPIHRGR